uniref:Secreted protein n=1 Tax=Knipowitschia caucasica TaxID=637954 RepID=A0AAV2J890_KNICA
MARLSNRRQLRIILISVFFARSCVRSADILAEPNRRLLLLWLQATENTATTRQQHGNNTATTRDIRGSIEATLIRRYSADGAGDVF